MVSIPVKSLPELNEKIHVRVSLPRSTPNTHMVEHVDAGARVVRHQPLVDDNFVGLAVRFEAPIDLGLFA